MKKRVFVGSSKKAIEHAKTVANELTDLGLHVVFWKDVFKASTLTLEAIENTMNDVSGAVLVASPDYEVPDKGFYPTPNVIFELGLFSSRLGRHNVALCRFDNTELPTDLNGFTYITLGSLPVGEDQLVLSQDSRAMLSHWADNLVPPPPKVDSNPKSKLRLKSLIVAAIILASSLFVFVNWTDLRIRWKMSSPPETKRVVFSDIGIGVAHPNNWQVEDSSFCFAGGDINLTKETKGISKKPTITLRFRNAQDKDIGGDVDQQVTDLKAARSQESEGATIDSVNKDDTFHSFQGFEAGRFSYKSRKHNGLCEVTLVRMNPVEGIPVPVNLELKAFISDGSQVKEEYYKEKDLIYENIFLDKQQMKSLSLNYIIDKSKSPAWQEAIDEFMVSVGKTFQSMLQRLKILFSSPVEKANANKPQSST